MNGSSIYTYPLTEREHVTDSLDCWCKPQFFVPCDECGPDLDEDIHANSITTLSAPACWKCGDSEHRGLIEIDHETASLDDVTCVIVHRE